MKRFLPFLSFILLPLIFWAASCESKTDDRPCADTLNISSGKANSIRLESKDPKTGLKYVADFIVIKDSEGKIVAYKSKEGWKVVDAGKALEVLIVDLELCKQSK